MPAPEPPESQTTGHDSPTQHVDLPPAAPAASDVMASPSAEDAPAAPVAGSSPAAEPPPAATPPPVGAAATGGATPRDPVPPAAARTRTPASDTQPALVIGIVLVVVGAIVLLGRVLDVTLGAESWPLWIVVPGVAMLVASFAIPGRGGLGLAIPGAMLTAVGLILWFQEANDAYATWAYAWALVAPTGVGVGMLLYGLGKGDGDLARDGARLTVIGLALFFGFALFFEGVLGLSGDPIPNLDEWLPYAVIGLGVLLVVLSLFGGRRNRTA